MRNDFFVMDKNKNVLEVVLGGNFELNCDFEKLEERSEDASTEKHVPYIEEVENGYLVKVGKEVDHPMTEAHYIQFIEITVDGTDQYRKFLNPTDKPEALFIVPKGKKVVAKEYCNLHGLWKFEK